MPLVPSSLILPTLLFVIVYAVIISERINRSIVAMVGACLTIGLGGLTQEQALEGVDWNTIGLLTGMMIMVSTSRRSGLFQYVAVWSARAAKAHPGRILLAMQLTTAVLSAFLDNVTTVLLIVPVTMAIVRALDVPAYPYLLAEIFASNIGGTATLIGDPPNILIGSQVGLSFNDFVVHLTPVICVVMAAQLAMIHLVWGRVLCASPERQSRVMLMEPIAEIVDPLLLKQSIIIFLMVVVAFIFARQLHLEPAMIAMSGATALLLLDNWSHQREKASHNIHQTFSDVEWITIFFFIGLFIVVHSLEVAGLLKLLGDRLAFLSGSDLATAGYVILWSSAFLSAIIDNIPFVATMIPLIKSMAPAFGGLDTIQPLWWCLSLGACLGGNGTLIGASANLTVAGIAERNGVPFRFGTYLLYAMPMMVVSIVICHFYVSWRYF